MPVEAVQDLRAQTINQKKETDLRMYILRKTGDQLPFLVKLMNVIHLVGLKQPRLPKYNTKTGDLVSHIWEFKNALLLHQDGNFFQAFSSNIHGRGVTWFAVLKAQSIEPWAQVSQMFVDKFRHNFPTRKTLQTLYLL